MVATHYILDERRRTAWRPREELSVSEWAVKHMYVTVGANQGPYQLSLTPYLQEPMDTMTDPTIDLEVVVKSAQIGGTLMSYIMLGYAIDQAPGPVIVVLPDEKAAKEECRERIAPMIEKSPRLAKHIVSAGWNTQIALALDTMTVHMAWAKSHATLIRRPCRYAFVDEVDNCDKAGRLGDTTALVRKRITTYGMQGCVIMPSTPSTDHASAWTNYQASDGRALYLPCPKCGTYQVLRFPQIKIPAGERNSKKIAAGDLAWYECEACEAHLTDREHKRWMVERCVWLKRGVTPTEPLPVKRKAIVARAVFDHKNRWTPATEGEAPVNNVAGFHINALYSPWVQWSGIIAEFLEVRKDPDLLQVFTNSVLAEPWIVALEETTVAELQVKRSHGYPREVVPAEAGALIVGADVQKNYIYYAVFAWGPHRQCWMIREGIVETFDALLAVAHTRFSREGEDGLRERALYLAIDSGHRTDEVYEFSILNEGVCCCKGQGRKDYAVKKSEIPTGIPGKKVTLYNVNTHDYKTALHKSMHAPIGEPGCFQIHRETTDDFLEQLTAEHQVWKTVTDKRARVRVAVWEPKREHAPNHYLDAAVYARAIAEINGLLDIQTPHPQANPEPSRTPRTPPPKYGRRKLNFPMRRRTTRSRS